MKIVDSVFVYRLSGGDRLSWHGRYHAHGAFEYEIHFFLEGTASFLCNRTRYPVSSGRLFLTGPREFHSVLPEALAKPLTYYAILFSFEGPIGSEDEKLLTALDSSIKERNTVLSIDNNFRFQFEELLQMARSSEVSLKDAAVHLLSSFLYRWFGKKGNGDSRLSGLPDEGEKSVSSSLLHVERSLLLMQKEVRENIKIHDIAWKIGLSDEHFIRIFRLEVRMTPHQYFTRLKIEGASGLLISTDKSIGEISTWFGFENQFHFSRIFKKCTGMSPLVYRQTFLQTVDFS